MQNWFNTVRNTKLKSNKELLDHDKIIEWFFEGDDTTIHSMGLNEYETYVKFYKDLLITKNVVTSLIGLGIIPETWKERFY